MRDRIRRLRCTVRPNRDDQRDGASFSREGTADAPTGERGDMDCGLLRVMPPGRVTAPRAPGAPSASAACMFGSVSAGPFPGSECGLRARRSAGFEQHPDVEGWSGYGLGPRQLVASGGERSGRRWRLGI
jgi:hypothetical protein